VDAQRTSPPLGGRLLSLHRVLRLLPKQRAAVSGEEKQLAGATG